MTKKGAENGWRKKKKYQERKNERKNLSLTENRAKEKGKVRRHLNLLKLKV